MSFGLFAKNNIHLEREERTITPRYSVLPAKGYFGTIWVHCGEHSGLTYFPTILKQVKSPQKKKKFSLLPCACMLRKSSTASWRAIGHFGTTLGISQGIPKFLQIYSFFAPQL